MISSCAALLVLLAAPLFTVCPSGCPHTSIQAALDAASVGDTVIVGPGTYQQLNSLLISKEIHLSGANNPTIVGNGQSDVIVIHAPKVSVRGISIHNSGASYLHEIAGIRAEDSADCSIEGNTIVSDAYGIYLANSGSCSIIGNSLHGSYHSESESGNGIHSWSGNHHVIENNTVEGHRDGIYLEFTNDSKVLNNTVTKNIRYGLHFMTSHKNLYHHNRFAENGAGVAVMYSRQVKMFENDFMNNRGPAAYGLLLKDISQGEIKKNRFIDNTFGIYMEGTNRSQFEGNSFNSNGYAIRILGDCDDNTLRHNSFSGNTFDASTNSSHNPNLFQENYWSNYQGYDLDRDGIGDVPYRPVSLSSMVIDKLDSTYTLIKSPLLTLMDQIEQEFPMLIPETLKDERPLMLPWRSDT